MAVSVTKKVQTNQNIQRIEKAGGRVVTPRTDIGPNMGAFAAFTDPVGNEFGLYEEPQR